MTHISSLQVSDSPYLYNNEGKHYSYNNNFEEFIPQENSFENYVHQLPLRVLLNERETIQKTAQKTSNVTSCRNLEGKLHWQKSIMNNLLNEGKIENFSDFLTFENGDTMMARYCAYHCPVPCYNGIKKAQELLNLYDEELSERIMDVEK